MIKTRRLWLVAIVLVAVSASIYVSAESRNMLWRTSSEASTLPVEGRTPSLAAATAWLNSQPLSAADLHGKVALIQFWTYTCINWLRTAPYVRAWAEKYKDQGLVVIGVHTPEFSVEKDLDNVRRATKEQKVNYPVAVDNDYVIWRAFDNNYWPAFYIVDAEGRVRHYQFGEGEYDRLETVIQQLLAEAGYKGFDRALVSAQGHGAELAADWTNLATPETYVGYGRGERFSSVGAPLLGQPRVYAAPARLDRNEWALVGDWTIRRESSLLNAPNGKVLFRFHARDLHLVMGPATRGASLRYRVLIDGEPPGTAHGVDVDDAGYGVIDQPRMYQLIRQPGPIEDRQFEIQFLDPGAEVFVFTFG
jgi:thiol-disulfide isomerase/thioredoxin